MKRKPGRRAQKRWTAASFSCSSIAQLSITVVEAIVSEPFPEIDPDLRVGEIELGPDVIERLLGHRIAGDKEREFLMPLAGPGDRLLR
jgi:hypothetical protein